MRLHRNVSPGDLGVASKLFPRDTTVMHGSYPYESAVQELKLLCRDYCPQKKLECIGKISEMLKMKPQTLSVCSTVCYFNTYTELKTIKMSNVFNKFSPSALTDR